MSRVRCILNMAKHADSGSNVRTQCKGQAAHHHHDANERTTVEADSKGQHQPDQNDKKDPESMPRSQDDSPRSLIPKADWRLALKSTI
eukprot:scaffold253473_cov16-Prasinocladus_malaysianus.AAC.1